MQALRNMGNHEIQFFLIVSNKQLQSEFTLCLNSSGSGSYAYLFHTSIVVLKFEIHTIIYLNFTKHRIYGNAEIIVRQNSEQSLAH